MAETPDQPRSYRVVYSERVRVELVDLISRAKSRGLGQQVLDALKAIDRRLSIYPQFGQPLRDLKLERAQVWIGVIPPLVMEYVIDDERRCIMVVVPFRPLPGAGLEPS